MFELQDPVYRQTIRFCFGGDDKTLVDLIKETDGCLEDDPGEFSTGIVYENRFSKDAPPAFWIWIRRFRGSVADYAFLAHELSHLIDAVLIWLEVPFTEDTTEPRACLVEYYFEQILTHIREVRRK